MKRLPLLLQSFTLCLTLLSLPGCMGDSNVGGQYTPEPTPEKPAEKEDTAPAFTLPRDLLALLPFKVRLAKVATVAGLAETDPALSELKANRLDLGDFDLANGIRADRAWTPSRITLWVRSLRPVCNSSQMKALYPSLPADLDKLLVAAHGRPPTPEDSALIAEALAAAPVDDAGRYLVVCLAVLSSAEFVSR